MLRKAENHTWSHIITNFLLKKASIGRKSWLEKILLHFVTFWNFFLLLQDWMNQCHLQLLGESQELEDSSHPRMECHHPNSFQMPTLLVANISDALDKLIRNWWDGPSHSTDYFAFGEASTSTWEWGNPIDKAPQTNPDSWPRSEPALELHSVGVKCRRHVTVPAVSTEEAIPEEGG